MAYDTSPSTARAIVMIANILALMISSYAICDMGMGGGYPYAEVAVDGGGRRPNINVFIPPNGLRIPISKLGSLYQNRDRE